MRKGSGKRKVGEINWQKMEGGREGGREGLTWVAIGELVDAATSKLFRVVEGGREEGREGGREGRHVYTPGVAIGELIDPSTGEFLGVVPLDLFVRHLVKKREGGKEGGREG